MADNQKEEWLREQAPWNHNGRVETVEAFKCHDLLLKHTKGKRRGYKFKDEKEKGQPQSLAWIEVCTDRMDLRKSVDNVDTLPYDAGDVPELDEAALSLDTT